MLRSISNFVQCLCAPNAPGVRLCNVDTHLYHAPRVGAAIVARTCDLSVIVPAYNEEAHLPELYRRLCAALDPLGLRYELICVDDGSTDATFEVLIELHRRDPRVRALELSRNFGKERAMSAGLLAARGDFVVVIDADLQHPPECIPEMFARIQDGFDVVYAVRNERHGQGFFRRCASDAFHQFLRRVADVDIVDGAGDFRMMRSSVVRAIGEFRESQRYMKGLFAWVGFRSTRITFDQGERTGGGSRWGLWDLVALAMEAVTSFSTFPLRLVTYVGAIVASSAMLVALYSTIKVLFGDASQFPTLLIVVLFVSAVQLIGLGIVGEYLGRTYVESKRRPLYFVRRSLDRVSEKESS